MSKALRFQNRRTKKIASRSVRRMREATAEFAAPPVQLQLGLRINGGAKLNGGFSDSAFGDNKLRPIHRWVPWIAGFSSGFVRDAFTNYLSHPPRRRACILDPFCGVGTTLIEAMLNGHDAIGFEINPYASLAARAKLETASISPAQFSFHITKFQEFMAGRNAADETASPPSFFKSRIPFFGERAEVKVLRALRFIRGIRVSPIRDLFSLAFGSVMVSLSNYSYEPSLSSRPAAGKPTQEDAPVAETILTKLLVMKTDIEWLRSAMKKFAFPPNGKVVADSFMNAREHIEPNSVDLVVTSPPYLNNYHYVRNTRPQLFWLGFVRKPKELKRLETDNFGKYWQTVRDLQPLSLDFDMPELAGLIGEIRLINVGRGAYGGQGWANYATAYFNDTDQFCHILSKVMRRGGRAVIVVGNSILQGVEIQVDNVLAALAQRHGLKTENIHIIRQKRVGASIVSSSVRQGARTSAKLYESAVVLLKP